ncbi:hypothetical protein B0G76_1710 [Paraburkholderia sp. BL23I1N1]|nr:MULTISPECIES: hypothetical protein [unclassified Paraburkholderia]REE18584.1 hypothetical protein B0G71_1638 [Paraburkholderia sp. BL27I4N3]RKE35598.1 hypothetical protein B0G76_1710 [Paraburkholderia sp. BL23I1N1]TCK94663.1 hypothetical protein B0G74_1254 [Paraburkholderia sp. BL9I2N2]
MRKAGNDLEDAMNAQPVTHMDQPLESGNNFSEGARLLEYRWRRFGT